MRASGGWPVCIVRHTRRSGRVWRVLSPSARSLSGPASGLGGFRRNARRIEYSRTQQKSRPREDSFDGLQRGDQSG